MDEDKLLAELLETDGLLEGMLLEISEMEKLGGMSPEEKIKLHKLKEVCQTALDAVKKNDKRIKKENKLTSEELFKKFKDIVSAESIKKALKTVSEKRATLVGDKDKIPQETKGVSDLQRINQHIIEVYMKAANSEEKVAQYAKEWNECAEVIKTHEKKGGVIDTEIAALDAQVQVYTAVIKAIEDSEQSKSIAKTTKTLAPNITASAEKGAKTELSTPQKNVPKDVVPKEVAKDPVVPKETSINPAIPETKIPSATQKPDASLNAKKPEEAKGAAIIPTHTPFVVMPAKKVVPAPIRARK